MDRQNENYHVFIGSSSAGIKYAKALKQLINEKLEKASLFSYNCRLWTDEAMFELSTATIESLIRISKRLKSQGGYAVLLFTPDDEVIMDHEKKRKMEPVYEPRDNVIFEMGLFMGVLGRMHTFCVCPSNERFHVLSDWKGIANALYKHVKKPRSYKKVMEPIADKIVTQIRNDIQNVPDRGKETIVNDYKYDVQKTIGSSEVLNPGKNSIRSTLEKINQGLKDERR